MSNKINPLLRIMFFIFVTFTQNFVFAEEIGSEPIIYQFSDHRGGTGGDPTRDLKKMVIKIMLNGESVDPEVIDILHVDDSDEERDFIQDK